MEIIKEENKVVYHGNPILIKSRSPSENREAPVKTYKLSEEELRQLNEKLGPPKRKMKSKGEKSIMTVDSKEIAISATLKEQPKENQGKKKKLKQAILRELLDSGMSVDQTAEEYEYAPRVVKMLIAKLENQQTQAPETPTVPDIISRLMVSRLTGKEFEYDLDGKSKTVTINYGQSNISGLSKKQLEVFAAELQEVLAYL